ncbi:MAG: hypothetical protein IPK11_06920 [Ignavibacteria bacterium]|nr:hypothetical protein [Ignavibacteria bacterium]
MMKNGCILIVFFLFSCNLSDEVQSLPGGWVYMSESRGAEGIYSNKKTLKNTIFPSVAKYDYNDDYIVALQRANREIVTLYVAADLRIKLMKGDTTEESYQKSFIIADSILDNNEYYKEIFSSVSNYWIIDIRKDTVYGPLTKKKYLALKKRMNIDLDL